MNNEHELADALALASTVTRALAGAGVNVIAALANGRRPLLYVDRMPAGVETVVKRSYPNHLGGRTVVRAAHYDGCQLEQMTDLPGGPAQVRHLRAVSNG